MEAVPLVKDCKRALLISTAYEPIAFVGYKKMFSLMQRGVVEVLNTWTDDELRAGQKLPAVMKLKNFVLANTAHRMCSYNRNVVLARDDYTCQYCSKILSYREATIDHVVPRSKGGKNHWTNCVTSCKTCNKKKRDHDLSKSNMTLVKRPSLPSIVHFWMANVKRAPREFEWHNMWNDLI